MHDDFRAAIHAALGHAPESIEPGRLIRFSTSGRRSDQAGWCKLFEDGRAGVFGDFRSGITETWTDVDRGAMSTVERAELARQVAAARTDRENEQRAQWEWNASFLASLWSECRALTVDDPAARYLRRRGIDAWPLPDCLRLHPAMRYRHDGAVTLHPAMVAPITGSDGSLLALHRTYLTPDGRKAPVSVPKKLTPAAGPLSGACIRLGQPAHGVIGVAEGIETALAAWCASSIPTVAAYSAGNLATWCWPAGVRRVVVFGDQDQPGMAAAHALRDRVGAAGLACTVMTPTDEGADWADVWAQRSAIEVVA